VPRPTDDRPGAGPGLRPAAVALAVLLAAGVVAASALATAAYLLLARRPPDP
jgi:hypothetical protein